MKFLSKKSISALLVLAFISGCTITIEDSRSSLESSLNSSVATSKDSSTISESSNSSVVSSISSEISSSISSIIDSSSPESSTSSSYMDYYAGVEGLSGEALKNALHDIIDDHIMFSYSEIWEILKETDEDPNNPNNVILLYSGISRSKNKNGGNVGDWNREHVWPQSKGDFGTSKGPGTDAHHLKPSDVQANSSRGNKDFDYVVNGKLVTNTTNSYYSSNAVEPRDEVKGDIARMLFYMAVRYESHDKVDLELTDSANNSTDSNFMGKLSTLLEWHLEDLPDEFELRRNEIIYSYQKNRNPFIDHPEFALLIWA